MKELKKESYRNRLHIFFSQGLMYTTININLNGCTDILVTITELLRFLNCTYLIHKIQFKVKKSNNSFMPRITIRAIRSGRTC